MKIDVYCNDGSPLRIDPTFIDGRGVGGAELSLMSWAEVMAERGHQIRIYNNPPTPGVFGEVEYLHQTAFRPKEDRDVFIAWRSPNQHIKQVDNALKVHWSCDQYTIGNFAADIFPFVDKIVCISPYHVDYHKRRYLVDNDEKISYFDLGVRASSYEQHKGTRKVKNRCIWCSVPERGLNRLSELYPAIQAEIPDISLVITSDHSLWGGRDGSHMYRVHWVGIENVEFLGAIPRPDLARLQMEADLTLGSFVYEELFGISMAEGQFTGAIPISGGYGSLPTTNKWGEVIPGDPHSYLWGVSFVEAVVELLSDRKELRKRQNKAKRAARKRFDWNEICKDWEYLLENNVFPEKESW